MYKNRLEEIKEIHEQASTANERFQESNAYADQDVVTDSLSELFYEEHTDWLIQQVEKVKSLEDAIDYVLTAKPEHYNNAKNMLDDFKVVIDLTLKGK